MRAVEQAAWRLLPRFHSVTTIGAGSTAVDVSDLAGAIVAFVSDADMNILATNDGSTPTATAAHFPVSSGVAVEFKIASGDTLAAIGAGDLSIFITG